MAWGLEPGSVQALASVLQPPQAGEAQRFLAAATWEQAGEAQERHHQRMIQYKPVVLRHNNYLLCQGCRLVHIVLKGQPR